MTAFQKLIFLACLPTALIAMQNTLHQEIMIDPTGGNTHIARNQSKIDKIENDRTCDFGNCKLHNNGCGFFVTGTILTGSSLACWIDYAVNGTSYLTYIGGAMDVVGGSILVGLAAKKGYNCIMPWYLKRKQQRILKNYQPIV